MAQNLYKYSLSIRATLYAGRFRPSVSQIFHYNDREKPEALNPPRSKIEPFLPQTSSLRLNSSSTCISPYADYKTPSHLFSSPSKLGTNQKTFRRTPYVLSGNGVSFRREMSTSTDSFVVSVAAADSSLPIAALQNFINGVHSVTGFNWWASIVISTLLATGSIVPLIVYIHRKPGLKTGETLSQWFNVKRQVPAKGKKPPEVDVKLASLRTKVLILLMNQDLKLFSLEICVFFAFARAIENMAGNVPSFKTGGILWFTDLSTSDPKNILPVIFSLACLVRVEMWSLWPRMGQLGIPGIGPLQNFARVPTCLCVPIVAHYPTAVLCSWIPLCVFNSCFLYALRDERVKKALGIPESLLLQTSTTEAPRYRTKSD